MNPDPFDEIARLIETAGAPFPVVLVRRLILRATSRATVNHELAEAIDRLNLTVVMLAEVVDFHTAITWAKRQDALDDLRRLRMLCRVNPALTRLLLELLLVWALPLLLLLRAILRGAARLDGTRKGDTLNLQIRWPDRGSGARFASMQVASIGSGQMRIVTVERNPKTGMPVVTAKIEFSRN